MKTVSPFERNVLRLLRAVLRRAPGEDAVRVLSRPLARPRCLGRPAVELVQDMLAKGLVHWLARTGGWHDERHLRAGAIAQGRLWQRTDPVQLGLTFTGHSLELLVRLTAGQPPTAPPAISALSAGDRLLLALTFEAARETDVGKRLHDQWTPLARDGLCRLLFPEELADRSAERLDWSTWLTEPGSSVLEALQPVVTERWVRVEQRKRGISDPRRMLALGRCQQRVLSSFLDALDRANRRDLARCLLDAVRRLVADRPAAERWVGGLDLRGQRLADRAAIYDAALALLLALDRLHAWQEEARAVTYFDEGYAASQLWKADWERLDGDACRQRVQAVQRELAPLRSG